VTIDSALLGLIAPLLPEIEQRTGANAAELGLALAADAIPIVLLALPIGRSVDRVGGRPLLIGGILLIAAGSAVIAVTSSLEVLVAGRVLQGVGSAMSWISALTIVSDLAPPDKRGESLGIAFAMIGVGSIAGPTLGGVAADLISYAAPFLIVCALSLAVAVAGVVVLPRERRAEPSETPALRAIARSAGSRKGAIATSITLGAALVLGMLELVVPLDLDARLGLSAAAIGVLFGGSIAVDSAIAPFGGRWGDRSGRRRPAVIGLATLGASCVALAALGSVVGAAVGMALFGAGLSLAFTAAVPWLDEAFGELERGLGYGVLNLLYAAGYALGPVLGGVLLSFGSADLAYLLTAAALGVGTVVVLLASASITTAPSS
jgi:MFS family permease